MTKKSVVRNKKQTDIVHNGLLFLFFSFVFFCPSFVVVYVISWISNLFQPIPKGVDMYREAATLAKESFPNTNTVAIISIILGVLCAIVVVRHRKQKRNAEKTIPKHSEQSVCNSFCAPRNAFVNSYESEKQVLQKDLSPKKSPRTSDENDWFDHSLEDHDNEDGWCTECEEFEEDLD